MRSRRPSSATMPVVMRMVLPLAAGAVLSPVAGWAGVPAAAGEPIPLRILLPNNVAREERLIGPGFFCAGAEADAGAGARAHTRHSNSSGSPQPGLTSRPASTSGRFGPLDYPVHGARLHPDVLRISSPPRGPPSSARQ